jgi:hypothetical protein
VIVVPMSVDHVSGRFVCRLSKRGKHLPGFR